MQGRTLVLAFSTALSLILCDPEAEADPSADPLASPAAEAEPSADPNSYMGSRGNMASNSGPFMPNAYLSGGWGDLSTSTLPRPISGCGMVEQCCGAASEGCCMGEQKCYTTWERKCEYENKPFCRTDSKQMCDSYPLKSCRMTKTTQYFDVPGTKCERKQERKCWDYMKKQCNKRSETVQHDVTWTEQSIRGTGERTEQRCHTVSTCNIVDDQREVVQQIPENKCEQVPRSRPVCRSVPVPQPPQEVTRTVMDVAYRQVCFNVPRQKCTTTGCSSGGCPLPEQSVCSSTEVMTQDVCGTCGYSGDCQNSCQQVQVPVCGTGSCTAGPQQCCTTENERVCQQVPYKVPRTITVTVQPPPVFKQECETVTEYVQQCRTVMVAKATMVPTKRCEPGREKKCFTFSVPDQQVEEETKAEVVSIQWEGCDITDVPDTYCTTVDIGVECTPTSLRKPVTINKQVCDQQTFKQVCYQVPFSNCENTGGQKCQMVPKQVCQPTCSTNNKCNECSSFVSGGGFGNCNLGTCNNFIPQDATFGNFRVGGAGALGELGGVGAVGALDGVGEVDWEE